MSALLAGAALIAAHTNTAEIRDLFWDGEVLWAATGGGLEAWSADGERLALIAEGLPRADVRSVGLHRGQLTAGLSGGGAVRWDPASGGWIHLETGAGADGEIVAVLGEQLVAASGLIWPGGLRLDGPARGAVEREGGLAVATLKGDLWLVEGDGAAGDPVTRHALPGPALDLGVDPESGDLQIAAVLGSARFDGDVTLIEAPSTAAAGGLWGVADGGIADEAGLIARVPHEITALQPLPGGAVAIGTVDGLYLLDGDLERLTPSGQICGNFITGADLWRGQIVAATFDRGACVLGTDGRWSPIPGLPTALINDVMAAGDGPGDDLWLATSDGLVRYDGERAVTLPSSEGARLPRSVAATNHRGVNGLARADRTWFADVVGPTSVDDRGRWRRHRYAVWGTSYQDVAACGGEAWFASEDAGVSWTDGSAWRHHDASTGLPDDWIMAAACDAGGRGWAGTYQDGLWAFDGDTWQEIPGLPDPWVLSLERDPGGLWVGTMGGLFRWTEAGGFQPVPGASHPAVHELTRAGDLLLVGAESGLAVYALVEAGGAGLR